jgi:hypothetical protein
MKRFVFLRSALITFALVFQTRQVAFAAGFAPDSIAGKVYRDSWAVASLRGASESTVVFGADGRYVFLKDASLNFVSESFAGAGVLLRSPRSDGTYVYSRTGESAATLELRGDDGGTFLFELQFTSPTGGEQNVNGVFPDRRWTLTDSLAVQTAPAVNISTRGVVSPGHPVIVGFVVPGTRAADPAIGSRGSLPEANQRDILIRVIGPSLVTYGVTGVWSDPDFSLHREGGTFYILQYRYRDWSRIEKPDGQGGITSEYSLGTVAAFGKVFDYVGAFPLVEDSKDAAMIVRLAPGAYTVVASARTNDPGGDALVEVYFLP